MKLRLYLGAKTSDPKVQRRAAPFVNDARRGFRDAENILRNRIPPDLEQAEHLLADDPDAELSVSDLLGRAENVRRDLARLRDDAEDMTRFLKEGRLGPPITS